MMIVLAVASDEALVLLQLMKIRGKSGRANKKRGNTGANLAL